MPVSIISGDIHERVSLYFQSDFAQSTAQFGTTFNNQDFAQIRDLYADLFLTKDKEWRIRGGISKVPFGFETLQSSQQRLALDRTDAINSAAPNERDIGFFSITPRLTPENYSVAWSTRVSKGAGTTASWASGSTTVRR